MPTRLKNFYGITAPISRFGIITAKTGVQGKQDHAYAVLIKTISITRVIALAKMMAFYP